MRLSILAAWCVAANVSPLFAQVAAGEITGVVTITTALDPRVIQLALKFVF
jgi:hypothetical protein